MVNLSVSFMHWNFTFKFFNIEMSEIFPMLFSDKFKCSNCWFELRCSSVLMLLPCKFKYRKWTKSFNPSIVIIPLWDRLSSCSWCKRETPYIRSKLFLRNDNCKPIWKIFELNGNKQFVFHWNEPFQFSKTNRCYRFFAMNFHPTIILWCAEHHQF